MCKAEDKAVYKEAEEEVANRAELKFVALVEEKLEMEESGKNSGIVHETGCNTVVAGLFSVVLSSVQIALLRNQAAVLAQYHL